MSENPSDDLTPGQRADADWLLRLLRDVSTARPPPHPGLARDSRLVDPGLLQQLHDDVLSLLRGYVRMVPPMSHESWVFIQGVLAACCFTLGHGDLHGCDLDDWYRRFRDDMERSGCHWVSPEEFEQLRRRGEL